MLSGMLSIVVTWMLLFAIFAGIGLTFQRMLAIKTVDREIALNAFWFGWCAVLGVLQIWHLAAPVNATALTTIFLAGAIGVIYNRKFVVELFARTGQSWRANLLWLLPVLILLFWLSNQAMAPIKPYDAGLYHLGAIRWISTYPVVPGLANLHDRFGFNSSYFLFQAMLDVGVWAHASNHVASGLLLLAVFLEIFCSLYKIASKQAVHVYDLLRILLLAPLLGLCGQASSTSPDVANFIIGVLISIRLSRLLFSKSTPELESSDVFLIAILSAIGITVKIAFLIMGFLTCIIAGKLWFENANQRGQPGWPAVYCMGSVSLILGIWMVRNVILTGYPLYPLAALPFPVDWKMPDDLITNLNGWIKSWARNPNALPAQVLTNWNWIDGWVIDLLEHQKLDVLLPLLLFVAGTFVTLFSSIRKSIFMTRWLAFFLPALGALLFWFLSAPEPRYAGATFWYLGAGAVSLAYGGLFHEPLPEARSTTRDCVASARFCSIASDIEDHTTRP